MNDGETDINTKDREESEEVIMVKKRTMFLAKSFVGGIMFLAGVFVTMLFLVPELNLSTKIVGGLIGLLFVGTSIVILLHTILRIK